MVTPLFEMATVLRDTENNICITVNPDSGRIGDPYFKFFNNSDYTKATHVIRILFKTANYAVHKDGKKLWKLNHKDKKLLVTSLNKLSRKYKNTGATVWDAVKFDWNFEYLQLDIEMDEYLAGEYDEMYKNEPSYVPSTYKMPDYMQLEVS